MNLTFASWKRLFRTAPPKPEPPQNVVDLSAERAKRWLLKHTRPMPPKESA